MPVRQEEAEYRARNPVFCLFSGWDPIPTSGAAQATSITKRNHGFARVSWKTPAFVLHHKTNNGMVSQLIDDYTSCIPVDRPMRPLFDLPETRREGRKKSSERSPHTRSSFPLQFVLSLEWPRPLGKKTTTLDHLVLTKRKEKRQR